MQLAVVRPKERKREREAQPTIVNCTRNVSCTVLLLLLQSHAQVDLSDQDGKDKIRLLQVCSDEVCRVYSVILHFKLGWVGGVVLLKMPQSGWM